MRDVAVHGGASFVEDGFNARVLSLYSQVACGIDEFAGLFQVTKDYG